MTGEDIHNKFNKDATTEWMAKRIRSMIGVVSEEEMAEVLGLNSVDTLATWRSQRRGPPHVKLGKRVFYTVSDLGNWVQQENIRQSTERNAPAAP